MTSLSFCLFFLFPRWLPIHSKGNPCILFVFFTISPTENLSSILPGIPKGIPFKNHTEILPENHLDIPPRIPAGIASEIPSGIPPDFASEVPPGLGIRVHLGVPSRIPPGMPSRIPSGYRSMIPSRNSLGTLL